MPRAVLPAGHQLFRTHRAANQPLFFSSAGIGRFDPVHAAGQGACYLAEEPLGAWVESFRTVMTIAEVDVSNRAMTIVGLERDLELVDLSSRAALRAGA